MGNTYQVEHDRHSETLEMISRFRTFAVAFTIYLRMSNIMYSMVFGDQMLSQLEIVAA